MTRYVSAIPAYGRDYTTEEAVRADWAAKKDFLTRDLMVHDYVNIDDKPANVQLNIRYDKQREICVIEADEEPDPDPRGTGPDRYPNAYFDGDHGHEPIEDGSYYWPEDHY